MRLERLASLGAPRPCLLVAPALLLAANLGVAALRHVPDEGTLARVTQGSQELARISSRSPVLAGIRKFPQPAAKLPYAPREILDNPAVASTIKRAVQAPPPPPPPPPTPPPTSPPPPPPSLTSASLPHDSVWRSLSQCESGGNWQIDSGNGYYGGLQFSLPSWQSVGGTGYPHEHPAELQVKMAERLQARQGWSAWPTCSSRLGLA